MEASHKQRSLWLLTIALCIIKTASNTITPNNKVIKRQSGTQSMWPQVPTLKSEEVLDVQTAIAKLNTTYIDIDGENWPQAGEQLQLGAVSAVALDKEQNVVIFHRVDRLWNSGTFNAKNVYQPSKKDPIRKSTVVALSRDTGTMVYSWGRNLFFMPHGLTIDKEDNAWVTDVALHQVFKFGPRGSDNKPLMTLGVAFVPGSGENRFCKPTSVAVLDNGDFFVADGYCNARIIKYNQHGERILSWGQNSFAGISYEIAPVNYFAVPHALTLVPELQLVCTADRENGRIQCFHSSNGTFHSQYFSKIIGERLFSMDYTPANGGQFVIVNGPTAEVGSAYHNVRGYIMDFKSQKVVSKFGPDERQFSNPHDVAITADGKEIYVAELNPMRIHKFTRNNGFSLTKSKPIYAEGSYLTTDHFPSLTAVIVASLMLLFAVGTFLLAFLVARRHQRGCLLFGEPKPRHAWDFPTKPEGFKLGNLLSQRRVKRNGFEKLDQNASDEEHETPATTTTTTSNNTTTMSNTTTNMAKKIGMAGHQYA